MTTENRNGSTDGLAAILERLRRPVITDREEERRLIALAQEGDDVAMRTLLGANCGMVIRIAKRHLGRGHGMDDLFMCGLAGLHQGIIRYDLANTVRLCTYASWWIRSHVQDGVITGARNVHLPLRILEAIRDMRSAEHVLAADGEDVSDENVAALLGTDAERVRDLRMYGNGKPLSFDEPVADDSGDPFGEIYLDPEADERGPEQLLIGNANAHALRAAMQKVLSPSERAVIEETFFNEKTLEETGVLIAPYTRDRVPVTRERARQLQVQALKKLQKELSRDPR